MINPNLMNLRIELSNAKKDFSEKELKIKRLFWEIQTFANPYYKSVAEIKADEMFQCSKDMRETKIEMLKIEEKIKSIKAELGEF